MARRPASEHRPRRCAATCAAVFLLAAAAAATFVLTACGGDRPAVDVTVLTPSPGAQGDATSVMTLSPSPLPDSGATPTPPTKGATPTPTVVTPTATAAAPPNATDGSIRLSIRRRISQDPALQDITMRVEVKDRVVTLVGRVKSEAQRERCQQIALTEPGVKRLISAIEVMPNNAY
jgi:hypothetical protein